MSDSAGSSGSRLDRALRPAVKSVARRWMSLLLLAALAPACGEGTVVVVVINIAPTAAITAPAGASLNSGNVTISYTLSDPEADTSTILVEFSTDTGTTFAAATAGPGGDGTSGLATSVSPGTVHTFIWNSLVDVGAVNNAGIQVRITPSDAQVGTAGTSATFTVDNSTNVAPTASAVTTTGTAGLITVSYTLSDPEANPCSVLVQFQIGAGTFAACTAGPGGDGTTNLTAAIAGTAHTFTWNSVQDIPGSVAAVTVKVTPSDGVTGTAASATPIATLNNTANTSGATLGSIDETTVFGFATAGATDGTFGYVVGQVPSGLPNDDAWRIEKIDLKAGTLDGGFGTAGVQSVNPGTGGDVPIRMVIDSTAMYILAIKETGPSSGVGNWYLEKRLLSTGALVTAFKTTGKLTLANNDGAPGSLAVDGSFIYLVLGEKSGSDYQWRLEKRNKLSGDLITLFGTSGTGVIVSNVNTNPDAPSAIVIDNTHMWIGGVYDASAGGTPPPYGRIRVEKRLLTTGALDLAGFGTGGVLTPAAGVATDEEEVRDMISDGTSLFLFVDVKPAVGSNTVRVEKRLLTTGAQTASVVSGGSNQGSSGNNGDPGNHFWIDGASLYVGYTDSSGGSGQWRIEKRLLTTLALDGTFAGGGAGVLIDNPSGSADYVNAFFITGGVIYAAGSSNTGGDHWRLASYWK